MEHIEFENKIRAKVEVEPVKHKEDEDLKHLSLVEGYCLLNSYNVAKIKRCNLVEGFLVTKFKDNSLNCVGHVWNEINGSHFDFTLPIKGIREDIESHEYFLVEKYDWKEKKTEMRKENGQPPSIFERDIVKLQPHIVFKTNVQLKELDMLKKLKTEESESEKE